MAVSNVIPRLRREHPAVKPFLRHQLLMGAALRHAAVFKHRHAVAELTGGQSVGDKQRGLVLHELIQMPIDFRLRDGIERCGRLVHHHDGRILVKRAGNGHLLPLAAGKLHAFLVKQPIDRGFRPVRRAFHHLIQVELAQQKYRLPRLTGLGTVLSRLGGGIGTRGPGETKLQTDKRHIMRKIHYLENELEEVERRRALLRGDRKRREIPTVSLVGYTNSGKSTMLNALCGSDVYVQNQLFATLDPSVRRMETDSERDILLVDTVGFIKKLPHELVEAFKSTLEEAVSSDLLIHVVDMGCDDFRERIAIVEGILADIGATEGERFLVLNKADLLPPDFAPGEISGYSRVFLTSATEGTGLEMLREGIISHFAKSLIMFDFVLPYSDGTMLAFLHENGTVTSEEYLADGIRLAGSISDKFAQKLGKYL